MKSCPTIPLGSLTEKTRPIQYGVLKPGRNQPNGVPLIRVTDISSNYLNSKNLYRISKSLDEEFRRTRLNGGEVLISIQGTIGRVAICPMSFAGANISRTIALIQPDERIQPKFLRYCLLDKANKGALWTVGTTRASLNIGDLRKTPIPAPPLAEQERIVKLLDGADELRKLRAQGDHRTDTLMPALFHDMFGDPDLNTKGWPVKTLEQLAARLHQGINTAADKVQYQTSGYPILQAKHISSGHIKIDDARFVSAVDFAKYKDRHRPCAGNILFTNIGTIGKSVVVDQTSDFLVAWNIFLIALKPDVSPIFMNAYLQLLDKRGYFTGRNTGSATQFVSRSQIQAIKVPVPPISLQKEFAVGVADMSVMQAGQAASRQRLDDLFQSMLHGAFNGEL